MPSTLRRLLVPLLAVLMALAACGGSDDDSGDTATTNAATEDSTDPTATGEGSVGSVDEDYCNVIKQQQEAGVTDYEERFTGQLEAAPDELRGALETLLDNLDILDDLPNLTPEQEAIVKQPVTDLLNYQINRCGLPFGI